MSFDPNFIYNSRPCEVIVDKSTFIVFENGEKIRCNLKYKNIEINIPEQISIFKELKFLEDIFHIHLYEDL